MRQLLLTAIKKQPLVAAVRMVAPSTSHAVRTTMAAIATQLCQQASQEARPLTHHIQITRITQARMTQTSLTPIAGAAPVRLVK